MITLKQWMEVVGYRITEGSEYGWQCYGHNAHVLDSWSGSHDGHSLSITFDTQTQEVYEVQAHDYKNNRAYRLFNPEYKLAHDNEACSRDIDAREAWDEINYVDLETDEDFLDKAYAIVNDQEYDTRVQVPLTLEDEYLFTAMKMAHELDITLNEFFEMILRQELDKEKPFGIDKPAPKMKKGKKKKSG